MTKPLKIVFLMRHPLYLRLYEAPLRSLAADGHRIRLVFRRLEKDVDTSLLETFLAEFPNLSSEEHDGRRGWWWPLSDLGRSLLDYARYHEPNYAAAAALTARARRYLPPDMADTIDRRGWLRARWSRRAIAWACRALERIAPPDPSCLAHLDRWAPDLVLLTPLVDFNHALTDFLKAARARGIPTVLAVASWDNLSNKGLVQIQPDRVVLWNPIQKNEAVDMHGLDPARIVITGAQPFDQWFGMTPGRDRQTFCAAVGGLDPGKPLIVYLCSSTFICRDEVSFVREWLSAIRASKDPAVREAGVLIRPHPSNFAQWRDAELDVPDLAVWPRGGAQVVDAERKQDYFDTLYYASAVVGINTSGFIEAGIVGKRTLTLATEHFADTQEGTLHFHYLVEGGLLTVARSFDEHLEQLSETLADPEVYRTRIARFVETFVRPNGRDVPAAPRVAEAFVSAARLQSLGWKPAVFARPLRRLARRKLARLRDLPIETGRSMAWRDFELLARPAVLRPTRREGVQVAKVMGRLDHILSAAARSEGAVAVLPFEGPPALEALYWPAFLRWMREVSGIQPGRLHIAHRGLPRAFLEDITPNLFDVTAWETPEDTLYRIETASGQRLSYVLKGNTALPILQLYRSEGISLADWLKTARYRLPSRPAPVGGADERILVDPGPGDVGPFAVDVDVARKTDWQGAIAAGAACSTEMASAHGLVVGPVGTATVFAVVAGAEVFLIADGHGCEARDLQLLMRLAEAARARLAVFPSHKPGAALAAAARAATSREE